MDTFFTKVTKIWKSREQAPPALATVSNHLAEMIKEEEKEITRELTSLEMNRDDFRLLLLDNGKCRFDSHNSVPPDPNAIIDNNNNWFPPSFKFKTTLDYTPFDLEKYPTSSKHSERCYSELIRLQNIKIFSNDYCMATKQFVNLHNLSRPKKLQKITTFEELKIDENMTRAPNFFWYYPCQYAHERWDNRMGESIDQRDGRQLSFPVIQMEYCRSRQMSETFKTEENIPHPEMYVRKKDHIMTLVLMVPEKYQMFLIDHMAYFDRELTRFRDQIEKSLTSPSLLMKVYDRWNVLVDEFVHVQSCSKLKYPMWIVRDGVNTGALPLYERSFRNVIDRLDRNDFISKVVTAYLMHNLSWVFTSAPEMENHIFRCRSYYNENDYNMRWSPYSSEYKNYLEVLGSVGPYDSVKVIVTGENAKDITELCHVLTLFARTSVTPPEEKKRDGVVSYAERTRDKTHEDYLNATKQECYALRRGKFLMKMAEDKNFKFPGKEEKTQIVDDLFAAPVTRFSNYFAIQGIVKTEENQKDIVEKMIDELREPDFIFPFSHQLGDKAIPRKQYLYIDIDDKSIKIVTSKTINHFDTSSAIVKSVIDKIRDGTGTSQLFEEQLKVIVEKSVKLRHILLHFTNPSFIDTPLICEPLECDLSDIRLIYNATSAYFPPILLVKRESWRDDFRWVTPKEETS